MRFDYQSRIELYRNLSKEELLKATRIIEEAFCNRGGTVRNSSSDPYIFIFEGNEPEWGCLGLGDSIVRDNPFMKGKIVSWKWIDSIPEECANTLAVFQELGFDI